MARDDRAPGPALGRYVLGDEIAAGGMAVVHLGRMLGPGGFVRTVAIKRLHSFYASDPEFVSMFLDEARMAARVQHPNVVATFDVVTADDELFVVMEYVRGESLAELERVANAAREPIPLDIALGIISGVLCGLHAAHEAKTDAGEPLAIIHRDVSPQNVLVGDDGVARVLDFGIAKARFRHKSTQDGRLKGKLRYVAPEQLRRDPVDRRCDVYAASLVLWEMLTGERAFGTDDPRELFERILAGNLAAARTLRPEIPPALDAVLRRGLARSPRDRFATALEMAEALEGVGAAATPRRIGAWVMEKAGGRIDERTAKVVELESSDDLVDVRDAKRLPRRAPSHLDTDVGLDAPHERGAPLVDLPRAPLDSTVPAARVTEARSRLRRALFGAGVAAIAAGAVATCALGAPKTATPVTPAPIASETENATPIPSPAASAPAEPPIPSAAPIAPRANASIAPIAPTRAASPNARSHNKARSECDTPYFVDADGHKQFKARCL